MNYFTTMVCKSLVISEKPSLSINFDVFEKPRFFTSSNAKLALNTCKPQGRGEEGSLCLLVIKSGRHLRPRHRHNLPHTLKA